MGEEAELKRIIEIIQMNRENVYLLYEAVEGLVFLVEELTPLIPKGSRQRAKLITVYAKKALKHVRLKRDAFITQRSRLFSRRFKK